MPQKSDTTIRGPLLLLKGPVASSLAPLRQARFLARVGQTVRTLRKAKCLSIEKMAQISGIDRCTLAALEEGRRDCGIAVLCALEKSLDCAPGFLIRASDAMPIRPDL